MDYRQPVAAGQFYPQDRDECLAELQKLCQTEIFNNTIPDLPDKIAAAIVPHAGWVFSGDLAALAFETIKKQNQTVDTFIIFGANHTVKADIAVLYDDGYWLSPLGQIAIDAELARDILCNADENLIMAHKMAHQYEHSIEVQVPIIQYLFPQAKIVPIIAPIKQDIFQLGSEIAEIIKKTDKKIVCIASTDLTHYGPQYCYTPKGPGPEGLQWAKSVSDQKFIELASQMLPAELLTSVELIHHSCGPAASACTVALAKEMGCQRGILLGHTNSNDIMQEKFGQSSSDSVGYAAMVF